MAGRTFKVIGQNCKVACRKGVAYPGDTFNEDDVLRPGLCQDLLTVKKIEEVKSSGKTTKKAPAKTSSDDGEGKSKKKASKKKTD